MAENETHTPHRNVRVDDSAWLPFGDIAGSRGRSVWLKEFIDAVVDDAQLWHDLRAIAAARREPVSAVLNRALRSYVTRNRRSVSPTAEQQERAQ